MIQCDSRRSSSDCLPPGGVWAKTHADDHEVPYQDMVSQYVESLRKYKEAAEELERLQIRLVPHYFDAMASRSPHNVCLWSTTSQQKLTYKEVKERSDKIACWLRGTLTLPSLSAIGLMMENCNDHVVLGLALSKCGYTITLLNPAIRKELLYHYCSVAKVQGLVISTTIAAALLAENSLAEVQSKLQIPGPVVCWECEDVAESLDNSLVIPSNLVEGCWKLVEDPRRNRSDPLTLPNPEWLSKINGESDYCHVFTSGTTGNSKAARVSHCRYCFAGIRWSYHMRLNPYDIMYLPLPLFHGNSGIVGLSACWTVQCCCLIAPKFSVSKFWTVVEQHKVTAMIHIGEVWQYLSSSVLAQPPPQHSLRVACGNGLRPFIWEQMERRFGIQRIVEHYGQSEMPGTVPLINSYGKRGSCGFIPPCVSDSNELRILLIESDPDTLEVKRVARTAADGKTTFQGCALATVDGSNGYQTGECIIGLEKKYSGYTRDEDAEGLTLQDVVEPGDKWYRTRDVLRRDQQGFYYFVDRLGDNFRWKGHNVSTNEVADVLTQSSYVTEANVYGVTVGEACGKAGMAAVSLRNTTTPFDPSAVNTALADIWSICVQKLPEYARPRFLRILSDPSITTATFKLMKKHYVEQGFDETKIAPKTDLLFWSTGKEGGFKRLTTAIAQRISVCDAQFCI